MRAELGRLHARLGVTTIHVTHDQIEAMTLGNRVAVFSRGSLQQYAEPHRLYHQPANVFVAGFIGSPAMNFLEGTVAASDGGATIAVGEGRIVLPATAHGSSFAPGDRILVGIRPEHLRWRAAGGGPIEPNSLRARVNLVEQLEPESYVVVSLRDPAAIVRSADEFGREDDKAGDLAGEDARVLTLRVAAGEVPARESEIDLMIDASRVHLFDPASGKTLQRSEPCDP